MKALLQLAMRAREELAANPRLRLGVWVIAAILLFYWVALVQPDRLALAVDEYADTASRLASSQAVMARRDEWPGLLAAAQESDQALQQSFWRADTEGLAKAGLQETLEQIVADLDVRNVAIESGSSRPATRRRGAVAGPGAPIGQLFGRLGTQAPACSRDPSTQARGRPDGPGSGPSIPRSPDGLCLFRRPSAGGVSHESSFSG